MIILPPYTTKGILTLVSSSSSSIQYFSIVQRPPFLEQRTTTLDTHMTSLEMSLEDAPTSLAYSCV